MKTDNTPSRLDRRVAEAMDAGCEQLPLSVQVRLRQARQQALGAQPAGHDERHWLRSWQPTGLVSACVLVVALGVVSGGSERAGPTTALPAEALEDMDLLATEDELELFTDYEFYQWVVMYEGL